MQAVTIEDKVYVIHDGVKLFILYHGRPEYVGQVRKGKKYFVSEDGTTKFLSDVEYIVDQDDLDISNGVYG